LTCPGFAGIPTRSAEAAGSRFLRHYDARQAREVAARRMRNHKPAV
jgi:hypothetical protein